MIGSITPEQIKSIKWFSLEDQELEVQVFKVYDGDTFTGVFTYTDGKLYKQHFRMNGYDACEIKLTKADKSKYTQEQVDFLQQQAQKGRQMLIDLIYDKTVTVKCGKNDKYGRTLATVVTNDKNVNELLIQSGLVTLYEGGTKLQHNLQ